MNAGNGGANTYIPVVVLAVCGLFLMGCGPAVVGGTAAGAYAVISDERPVESQLSDSSVTLKITRKFVGDSEIRAVNIDVDTYQGIVYLSGVLTSKGQIEKVIQLAGSVTGVKMIKSNLQLKE